MFKWNGKSLKIGNAVIRVPVIQGGMGIGISLASLASAVANEGGVGVLSSAGLGMITENARQTVRSRIEALRRQIRRARKMTGGVLGVNIMVALSNFEDMVKTSIEEGIDIIFSGAGLPLNLPAFLREGCKTSLVPIVSSAKAVRLIAKWWRDKHRYTPDAIVVEGPLAGGHLGFKKSQIDDPAFALEKLVKDVLGEVRAIEDETGRHVPVIAAGGIYTGGDIRRFLGMGASGVQMATRFVATEECDADRNFKQAYLNCRKEDIGIIESPVGMPGRVVVNDFVRGIRAGEKVPRACPYHCISTCRQEESPYCIAAALINAYRGRFTDGFAFIGANGYRVDRIVTVSELFRALEKEYSDGST